MAGGHQYYYMDLLKYIQYLFFKIKIKIVFFVASQYDIDKLDKQPSASQGAEF